MSSTNSKKIIRQYVGEIPILQHIAQRLGIKDILAHHIPSHGNEKIDAADSLMLLIYNIACGRTPLYSLSWNQDKKALAREKNVDGIFPLLCTDKNIAPKSALSAYKYQPRLEKRFSQLKSIHNAAPLLFKNIERVEAIMFCFFVSLILQAVIEREVRNNMKKNKIDKLPIYPEHRLSYHPTTAKIFDRFCETSTYLLMEGTQGIQEFADSLKEIQLTILKLLNMSEYVYWLK